MESAIHAEGLVKRLGDLIVVDAIDLRRAGHRWIIVASLRTRRWAHGLDGRPNVRRRLHPSLMRAHAS